jgi:peptidoglycan hydrolase-like protein with peptidoglycan-binding domain
MQTRELQERLTELGFAPGKIDGMEGPATRTAAARFQLACALPGHNLVVDAIPGPRTWAAVTAASESGRLSPNFLARELRSKGDGTCWPHRDLLHALERLRAHVGKPLAVVSGWRDVAHNRRVGGARTSQHTYGQASELSAIRARLAAGAHLFAGRAADFNRGYITLEELRRLKIFSGLGHRDGWVTHVDLRTNATPEKPTTWRYG